MTIAAATRGVVSDWGWQVGTSAENRACLALKRLGVRSTEVEQQFRVGRYRLDFAWPARKIALEIDGWQHLRPEGAVGDATRDRWLREHGWLVFRVHDCADTDLFDAMLCRVVALARLAA